MCQRGGSRQEARTRETHPMQRANPTAVKKEGICSCCEVGGCESTIQHGLKGRAGSHVTLAFLERLYDEEA